jgi:hypothetical protein
MVVVLCVSATIAAPGRVLKITVFSARMCCSSAQKTRVGARSAQFLDRLMRSLDFAPEACHGLRGRQPSARIADWARMKNTSVPNRRSLINPRAGFGVKQ